MFKFPCLSGRMLASVVQREKTCTEASPEAMRIQFLRAEWNQTKNLIEFELQFCHLKLVKLFNCLELLFSFFSSITCLIRALTSHYCTALLKSLSENMFITCLGKCLAHVVEAKKIHIRLIESLSFQ